MPPIRSLEARGRSRATTAPSAFAWSEVGSNAFRVAIPRYVDFYLKGQLLLDEIISARRPLEEIDLCFDELRLGAAARDRLRVTEEPVDLTYQDPG